MESTEKSSYSGWNLPCSHLYDAVSIGIPKDAGYRRDGLFAVMGKLLSKSNFR
jgi:hypothetical protein